MQTYSICAVSILSLIWAFQTTFLIFKIKIGFGTFHVSPTTDFHETWYENHDTKGLVLLNLYSQ